jgi:hypothetical protein
MGGANKMIIEYYNLATNLSAIKSFTKTFPAKIELPFLSAGNYLVKLIYFDTITLQADTAFANLVVNGVTFSISSSLPSVCKNELVCFALNTNSSIAPIITYSDSLPFSLTYNLSGIYNFCHRFSKNDTAITQVYVSSGATCSHTYLDTIIIDKPIANFSWSPSGSQCLSKNVAFTDLSLSNFYPLNAASYQWNFYNQTGSLINSSNLINPQITFYPDDTISATLIIASTHGCLDTATYKNIISLDSIKSTFLQKTICSNQFYFFNGNNLNSSGIYLDTLVSYQGCDSTISLALNVNSAPIATFTVYPDLNQPHNWFLLNSCTGISQLNYLWNWGDGNTSTGIYPSHIYSSPSFYKICVQATDSLGCQSTYCDSSTYIYKGNGLNSIIQINVVNSLSADNNLSNELQESVFIYPNPTHQFWDIELINFKNDVKIKLYNSIGSIIKVPVLIDSNQIKIDASQLSSGIYLVTIISKNKIYKQKLIKK